MHYAPQALLAGGLGFAVSFLVACGGGSGLLTADQANNLNSQLDQVSSALDAGQCDAAASAAAGLRNAVENLPASINSTLVSNLKQGASTVGDLATTECHSQTTKTTTTPTTSTSTTSTTSTQSTTTTPSTTTSSSSTTTTAPPQTVTTTATTTTGSGTTSTAGGSGGAGLLGGGGGSGSGGAGTGNGNGNGNRQ
jgi:hypothetical protein